ncbi:hypothetical protein [Moorella stamsii]|nr:MULTISPECIES: hypothetical protein [Moorella]
MRLAPVPSHHRTSGSIRRVNAHAGRTKKSLAISAREQSYLTTYAKK